MARFCDIVMKGGITSGIVYPAAVCEIAKQFTFKNIGGTSAGAIAAALSAAAERQRARNGAMDGFDRLGKIPDYLAADEHLFRLFVPTASARSLFRTTVGLFGRARFRPAAVAKWCGLVWAYPVAATVGAIPGGVFLLTAILYSVVVPAFAVALAPAALTIVAGMTLGVVVALVRDLLRTLPQNGYGMVKGVDDADRASENALCTWLTRELEETAGLEPGRVPLTFGMMWDAQRDVTAPGLGEKPPQPDVNLEMITTNVTSGRPYQFPSAATYYYDADELRAFFPDHVIEWMKARPRPPRNDAEAAHFKAYAPKLPLPLAGDLPVIVATRMSLAFPILLSAVPLYAPDYTMPVPASGIPPLEHSWFSDGGISSNFPVTLFDSPLPHWPTFAINLAPFSPAHPRQSDETKNVYMPATNAGGRLPSVSRIRALPGFLSAIVDSMQNWNDNAQSHLPGYRDRIVTLFLADDEGGLNLDMPPDVMARLRKRGAAAGALIASRFQDASTLPAGKGAMNWENHRWLRYRTTMGAAKAYLASFSHGYGVSAAPDVSYDALIAATDGTPAHHYPIAPADRAEARQLTAQVSTTGDAIAAADLFDTDLPKPSPHLVLRPSLET